MNDVQIFASTAAVLHIWAVCLL